MKPRAMVFALLVGLAAMLAPGGAGAVNPDEVLKNPVLEARAREISAGLRCLVCQNQSIDDSNADLARDLRILVRDRLTAGDTDAQAVAYIVARYGNYVLLKPPVNVYTIALWLAPAGFLLLGMGAVVALFRRRQRVKDEVQSLTPDEEKRLAKLLVSHQKPVS
ncbi:MAG: cytochrome c-type biogenesis protein [Alphaproteobacteria bacterium]